MLIATVFGVFSQIRLNNFSQTVKPPWEPTLIHSILNFHFISLFSIIDNQESQYHRLRDTIIVVMFLKSRTLRKWLALETNEAEPLPFLQQNPRE